MEGQGASQRQGRVFLWALGLVATFAWVLRALPLLRHGAWGHLVDYDEGVYFSASALLWQGLLPYRDFAFVHPPGLLYVLGAVSWLAHVSDPAVGFAAARWLATLIGAANVFLAGRVAGRWVGPVGGLAAAALYATYPEVVTVERGPFLEPVLNLTCLGMAWVWLGAITRRRAAVAGALCGLALAVKVWAGIWLLAVVVASADRRRLWPWFAGAAALTLALLVAPLALRAPSAFVDQTVVFHLRRPPDGTAGRWERLRDIADPRHLASSVLGAVGLALVLARRSSRSSPEGRFFAAAYLLTLAAFLAPAAYWNQYNAHLVASESVLAGAAAAALWQWAQARRVAIQAVAGGLLAFAPIPSARRVVLASRRSAPDQLALARALRTRVAPADCLFTFEPAWGLSGGRLPPVEKGPVAVDSYARMLLGATAQGRRYPDVNAAFQAEEGQREMRSLLEGCRFVVLGWRGRFQLSSESQRWLEQHFARRHPADGEDGIDLWERVR